MSVIKTWAYERNKKPTKTKESIAAYEELQNDKELIAFHHMTLKDGGIAEAMVQEAVDALIEVFNKIDKNL